MFLIISRATLVRLTFEGMQLFDIKEKRLASSMGPSPQQQ